MIRRSFVLGGASLPWAWAARARAAGRIVGKPDFSALDDRLGARVAAGYFSGAGLIIGRQRTVLHGRYFGDGGPDRALRVASLGKWVAAATIAAVVDEGRLAWSDPARKFLPELADGKGDATLRQLLSHTAGYPDYQPAGRAPDNYPSLSESVAHLVDLPPSGPPGARFQYGGLAMQVAGRMAEIASGADFEDLFQSRIARPLGIERSGFSPVSTEPGFSPMLGGAFHTTAPDFARFLMMVSGRGTLSATSVLSPAAIDELERDQVGTATVPPRAFVDCARADPRRDIYGLGQWREETDDQGRATLLSSPGWAGAYGWCDRRHDLWGVVIAKANVERAASSGYSPFLGSSLYAPMARAALRDAARPQLRRRKAGDLHVEEMGAGDPVIFLHGHGLDRTQWEPQFLSLSAQYRVIRYDLRGYGRSPDPVSGVAFRHVDDLAAVMDALGLHRAHLVGLSLGGFVVTDFLALHAERALSATMAGGDLFDSPGPSTPVSGPESDRRRVEIAAVKAEGLFAFKRRWFDGLMQGAGSRAPLVRTHLWRMIDEWRAWQPLNIEPRSLLGRDAIELLTARRPTTPVLLIRGDREAKPSSATPLLLPRARLEILNDCGHISNLERPEAFSTILTRHLKFAASRHDARG